MTTSQLVKQIVHLKDEIYADPKNIVSVTFGVRRRQEAFVGDAAAKANDLITMYLLENNVKAYLWCLMPDRVHLILSPTEKKSVHVIVADIQALLKRDVLPAELDFYGDFFDHVLRRNENPRHIARQILDRPVSRGLVTNWRDYEFCGSTEYDLATLPVAEEEAPARSEFTEEPAEVLAEQQA